jgi:thiamine kinase-like enzyme
VESLREFESGTPQERWGLAALREFTRSEAGFPATLSLCHRDFAPYNLLRDRRYRGSRQWGVLDFEHARVDAPLVDVARALLTFGPARGDFLRAYQPGVAETQTAERVLPYLLLDLLQTLRWSKRHADAPREVSALNDLEQIVDCGAEVWIFG